MLAVVTLGVYLLLSSLGDHLNVIENFFNSVAKGECFLLGSVSQFLVNCVCMPFEYSNKYVLFLNLI